jgi:hypothetical protein
VVGTIGYLAYIADDAYYQAQRVPFYFAKEPNGDLALWDNNHRAMDKFGHIYTTSLFSQNIYFLARWSGYSNRTASWTAAILSISIMTGMEVWDAHFQNWGFETGDFAMNLVGGTWPVAQHNIPVLQNFDIKMSYNFFNEKSPEASVHDYSNMNFWLTANPVGLNRKFFGGWFPDFLNLTIGISLESYQTQRREIFIGLDYNLKQIRTRSVFLNHIISVVDRFHLPAPAIRIAPGYIGYGLYF